jgi:hypothetical protein
MKKISAKRAATAKLGFNSTFRASPREPKKVLTIAEMKEQGLLKRAKDAEKVPKAKSERAKWKAAADKWFSEFIRLRDSDEHGRVKCVTCSQAGHWRDLQNGHWITRGHEATRFDEKNCTTQCRGCNYNGGQHLKHQVWITNKYGHAAVDALVRKGTMACHRTTQDYKFLSETYKARVEHIKECSPTKYKRA